MATKMAIPRFASKMMFSNFAFSPPPTAAATSAPPAAEPSTKLFVSGLNKRTTSEAPTDAFAKFGEVVQARVVTDHVSGYSRGYGFVRYATLDDADEGIKGMDGKFLDGWVIFAEYARPKTQQSPPVKNTGLPPLYRNY
ncbi:organelle RRM domain-containing protein 2, mitochondrial-like [Papaver somniferum]|uniref:organelle RRM domain-containing protein 2, mitochondrial-like n=1 Tax=Papaver somniferum TaxID=3469 RepID=UPI000E6F8966|nr:organelle RRM domain-containing protein 2, mitochondrial-like [Papaver somniferum]